jgi:hypothetical protein
MSHDWHGAAVAGSYEAAGRAPAGPRARGAAPMRGCVLIKHRAAARGGPRSYGASLVLPPSLCSVHCSDTQGAAHASSMVGLLDDAAARGRSRLGRVASHVLAVEAQIAAADVAQLTAGDDNEPVQMTERECFMFDLHGFLIVREFLTPGDRRSLHCAA